MPLDTVDALMIIGSLLINYIVLYKNPRTRWWSGWAALLIGSAVLYIDDATIYAWPIIYFIGAFILFSPRNFHNAFVKGD